VASGIVGRDGRLREVEISSSDDPLFTQALLAAVAEWRFRPATVNGQPVAVFYHLVHDFTLR
jgi:TonB family protein